MFFYPCVRSFIQTTKCSSSLSQSAVIKKQKKRKLNFKNISTCCLSVGCFLICSLPQIIFSAWRMTSNNPRNDRQVRTIAIWCNTFVLVNSTFNCLIFFWRNSILRREGIKTAKCLWTNDLN